MNHPHTHSTAAFRIYVCLLLLTSFSYAMMYAPQPMFNIICEDLDVDRGHVGLLVSVFMLSLSISPLCVGLLLSRLGIRRAVYLSASLLAGSGILVYLAATFTQLLCVRILQGVLTPILLTSAMAGIAHTFRHFDVNRALAGFVTCSLLGALCGRILGGYATELLGWKYTLCAISSLFLLCLFLARGLPEKIGTMARVHHLRDYLLVLRQDGVALLLVVEACGIFTFAAIGNLIPLRMQELGQGSSEGLIGFMYLGYSIGLVASLAFNPLKRLFGTRGRLMTAGALLFVLSLGTLYPASSAWIFGGLWLIALGEFVVHSVAPGMINELAGRKGQCDRGMVNGLFLSCYYLGGVIGSWLPAYLYARLGWLSCLLSMIFVQTVSLCCVLYFVRKIFIPRKMC
ncbi:MAG: MFS transporter [Desulfovibrio sp.]|nr:MFS transporter [Desulfovibrio sp.]